MRRLIRIDVGVMVYVAYIHLTYNRQVYLCMFQNVTKVLVLSFILLFYLCLSINSRIKLKT